MPRIKLNPQELQDYLEFRKRGKRHRDRRKPRGNPRSLARRRAHLLED
ncbi:hypothetical protein [Thermus caldilimi]|nr:hypothetical protein [Thermus caldilimi]